jgi:hypothetical protein
METPIFSPSAKTGADMDAITAPQSTIAINFFAFIMNPPLILLL